ncbi:MAG: hypothetical protein HeimC2_20560 [Candidatus Heimdallarchaeota archaeon LC_2]|nr:MAG: hypothetical protein HeimC2_20560 [Candidatus Heimdallarchaeota archaeon LC_2]
MTITVFSFIIAIIKINLFSLRFKELSTLYGSLFRIITIILIVRKSNFRHSY